MAIDYNSIPKESHETAFKLESLAKIFDLEAIVVKDEQGLSGLVRPHIFERDGVKYAFHGESWMRPLCIYSIHELLVEKSPLVEKLLKLNVRVFDALDNKEVAELVNELHQEYMDDRSMQRLLKENGKKLFRDPK